jgi:hypothetical protein
MFIKSKMSNVLISIHRTKSVNDEYCKLLNKANNKITELRAISHLLHFPLRPILFVPTKFFQN